MILSPFNWSVKMLPLGCGRGNGAIEQEGTEAGSAIGEGRPGRDDREEAAEIDLNQYLGGGRLLALGAAVFLDELLYCGPLVLRQFFVAGQTPHPVDNC